MRQSYRIKFFIFSLCVSVLFPYLSFAGDTMQDSDILKGKKICIDPGHGGTAGKDMFRQGPTGEREEWINLRVGFMLKDLLEKAGATVIITRTEDKFVELKDRADMAIKNKCDLFVSIHHNGTDQDNETNFPLVFFFKDARKNPASVDFAKILAKHIQEALGLPRAELFSDWTIYPNSGTAVLRLTNPYMPGAIGEASFFTNPDEEKRLKDKEYNQKEAQAYFDTIVEYFKKGIPTVELIEPKQEDPLSQKRPRIQFHLTDGLNGTGIDPNSIRVHWNDQFIGKSFNAKSLIVSIFPADFSFGEQTVRIYARNTAGQANHPMTYIFKTSGDLAKQIESNKKAWEKTKGRETNILDVEVTEPKPGKLIDEKEPKIILTLKDSKISRMVDISSFEIYFNYRKIKPDIFSPKGKRTRLIQFNPSKYLHPGTQILEIISAKDTTGRLLSISTSAFSFRVSSSTTERQAKEWVTAFEKGGKIVEDLAKDSVKKELSDENKETLLQGIDYLTRSIALFPDSPKSGKAQYLIGVAFEKLSSEPYYKEQAINAYTHTVDYYPTCDEVQLAHEGLVRLKSPLPLETLSQDSE